VKRIPLTQGKEALVSDQDYKYLMQWKWYYLKANSGKGGYAARKGPRPAQRQIYMHKGVAARKGLSGEIDHHDQNKLNNQRRNLRSTNHSGNAGNCGVRTNNKSGFKGVTQYKRWCAQISIHGKMKGLGYFPGTEAGKKQAARAYNKAAKAHFGKFAYLNKV
jgi:hypothetical protein